MSGGKVVLIDDDASVRKSLQRLLLAGGYDVVTLADAASYLAGPPPPLPACLLLDVRMPGMNGFELQTAIVGTAHSLPVVFITGHGDEEVRARALALGAVDVLFKPLDEAVLFGAIERALARPIESG
jgi:FixJ family two-component response regulator